MRRTLVSLPLRAALAVASLAVASLAVAPLAAQAPVITPAGDPSVRSDTVYALAADSARFPEERVLVLLDDGVVRLEPDGRGSETYRQVIQILREDAVEDYQEHSISWVPGRQKLTVNWFRVLKPDGTVVSDAPTQVQDSDVPAEMVDPVYSDQRVRRLSISGVAVGTILDYSYTIEDVKPFPERDAYGWWSVSMGAPVRRSRLVLDVPASLTPTIVETNLDFRRRETVHGGRRVYTWAKADVPRVKPEPFAADSNDIYMNVAYALPRTWADVGHWYAGLTTDAYTLGPEVRAKLAGIAAGARTREDSLRALHRWVAQDIRYVSVSLGTGGYQPRTPDEVVRTGFGDCKDKATLFVAALRAWGIAAHPVILRAGKTDRRLPTVKQFDHAIAAIERPGGGYRFVDLTASHTPWGELPYGPQGEFGIVVRADGRVDEVTIPLDPVTSNRALTRLVGELDEDGLLAGVYEESAAGLLQYDLRNTFDTPLDSTQRANLTRAVAGNVYPGAQGDSLETFDGRDLTATPMVRLRFHGGRAATRSGGTVVLSLNLGNMEQMAAVADQVEAQGPRRFPIDAERVIGPYERDAEVRITLPDGWRAHLPEGVHATSVFGEFRSDHAQEGRVLVLRRKLAGARGIYPPERVAELTAWLRAMAKEDTRFIILEPGG
ncbi:MAG TPA: DUF3857 domain-containing transglutaminase family protein [Gemmatimonadaceae bacterium]|nr:DUF3857 domain-containing transglutaminase family protein [Gemmatimonadaceae bacterium]